MGTRKRYSFRPWISYLDDVGDHPGYSSGYASFYWAMMTGMKSAACSLVIFIIDTIKNYKKDLLM